MVSEVYGGEAVKKSSVSEWHERFKDSGENVEDDERSVCQRFHRTGENVEKLRNQMH
jgi:hypothetical protein